LNNNNTNIDKVIRDKFELYTPTPPKHIWAGIEKGLSLKPVIPFYKNKKIIAISILAMVAIIASIVIINRSSLSSSITAPKQSVLNNNDKSIVSVSDESGTNASNNNVNEYLTNNANAKLKSANPVNLTQESVTDKPLVINTVITTNKITSTKPAISNTVTYTQQSNKQISNSNSISIITLKKSTFISPDIQYNNYILDTPTQDNHLPNINTPKSAGNRINSHWKIGGFLSAEITMSKIDSVEILNSYTLSIEPTYTINNHWFIRSGVGASYVRDRGFAEINYLTNDYIGSYDDVYDVTFDTISGIVTPTYHTKTVEVWDSVQHITVTNVTNKYMYLQVPLLIGYSFSNKQSNLNWYFMGGPAFSVKVGSLIDNPKPEDKDADIISLYNNLPVRSNSYLQLWIGAGLEYQLNKRLSFAVEPIYRYYFSSIYNDSYTATSSMGLTLRVGLVYKIK